jgi:hypothetical protein
MSNKRRIFYRERDDSPNAVGIQIQYCTSYICLCPRLLSDFNLLAYAGKNLQCSETVQYQPKPRLRETEIPTYNLNIDDRQSKKVFLMIEIIISYLFLKSGRS